MREIHSAGFVLISLLLAASFHIILWKSDNKGSCSGAVLGDVVTYEFIWRIATTAVLIPPSIEYALENYFISKRNLLENIGSIKEDRIGHGLILLSLVPCSNVPFWIFGNDIAKLDMDIFISLGHALFVLGVLSKLETFASKVWNSESLILVLTLYILALFSLLFGTRFEERRITYLYNSLQTTLILKMLATVTFFYISRKLNIIISELGHVEESFLESRAFICSILFIGLTLFLVFTTMVTYQSLSEPNVSLYTTDSSKRILIHLSAAIVTAILPGQVIRRGLHAMRRTIDIQREMNYKKTFVRYISHEVRSPLSTAMIGIDCIIDLIEKAVEKNPNNVSLREILDLSHDCHHSCNSAVKTLSDLLLFDKLENNMLSLDKKELSCHEFIVGACRPFLHQLSVAGMLFKVNIEESVDDLCMLVDPIKLEQVLRNFLNNAVKFTPIGGEIVVSASVYSLAEYTNNLKEDYNPHEDLQNIPKRTFGEIKFDEIGSSDNERDVEVLRVEVHDSGAGISMENIRKTFEEYTQFAANRLQGGKGSGLGLWISKAIVELHNGKIGVFSKGENLGTTFFFELPCYLNRRYNRSNSLSTNTTSTGYTTGYSDLKGELVGSTECRPDRDTETKQYQQLQEQKEKSEIDDSPTTYMKPDIKLIIGAPVEAMDGGAESSISEKAPGSPNRHRIRTSLSNVNLNGLLGLEQQKSPQQREKKSMSNSFRFLRENTLKRCLLADDSALTRKLVEKMLLSAIPSLICQHVSNGVDAVKVVTESLSLDSTQESFDLVLIDYFMPGLDGPEAIIQIREVGFAGFIIAITGSAAEIDEEKLLKSGADFVMVKPFNIRSFLSKLKEKVKKSVDDVEQTS